MIKDKINQMLNLPEEVKKQAIEQVFGTEVNTKGVIDIVFSAYFGDKNFHYGISLFQFLESKLQQEQDLTDLRRSVSQCTTVEYCKGWNDAIKAVQEQQERVDKNIAEANEILRKRVEPVNPELYKAMVREKDLDEIYWGNCEPFIDDEEATVFLMTDDGFKQAVAELQQPKQSSNETLKVCDLCLKSEIEDVVSGKSDKNLVINDVQYIKPKEPKFPSDEEIKAKISDITFDYENFTKEENCHNEYSWGKAEKTLTNFAKWLKGEK